ncbi:MAG TPA: alpha-galactosidase [Peptococcaceae bacterium]|nr:alpha-galactosidase [Peptococcaceae bacterium]
MNPRKTFVLSRILVFLGLISCLFLLAPTKQANADQGLVLSTRYPGISASPGETITFPLEIMNNTSLSQVVNLNVMTQPKDWKTSLKGGGRAIHQAFVSSQNSASVDLLVSIPDEAQIGEYSLRVSATSENGNLQDFLTLRIKVAEGEVGADKLTAKYSELKGPSDATFTFKVDLVNNGSNEQLYSLGAQSPEGWQVSFTPSYENQQVASIGVKPGETKSLDVKITPPVSIEAGEYIIPIRAASPVNTVTQDLKVIISGTYKLQFSTPSGRLNTDIVAGREKKVNLEVKNTGSTDLNNISFSSAEPINWSVTFEPMVIENLKPNESRQVTATITADNKAIAGDYLVSLTASSPEVKSTADLRVTVKTSTLWGLVGVLIVLAVIFGVYKAFQKYGRR